MQKKFHIAVLCGGPSLERGVSLNSARSLLDHLSGDDIEIVAIYFDTKKIAYHIPQHQLYSNTPSDFDFKLQQTGKPLKKTALVKLLKICDIVFPAIHGTFGEDGGIQRFLEQNKIPFVGSSAKACRKAFDKFDSNERIKQHGFYTLPTEVLKIYHDDHKKILQKFFKKHALHRAIIKPAQGGSSIGVRSVTSAKEALKETGLLFSKRIDTRVVVQPFCTGIEFTVIILQNRFGMPVAVLPTETEQDYSRNQIFDYRRKYLPTNQVRYHCPPRFDNETIERIQVQAEQLFTLLGMNDCARFDGWLLPDGNIWFADFNPVSGMEQNSFLFQQASRIGMSHADVLRLIVKNSCLRQRISFPDKEIITQQSPFPSSSPPSRGGERQRKTVPVLFGGNTSERQVSLMSGTNVWLKLRKSKKYAPQPYLLDRNGDVWKLPYALTLNHTVEEVEESCRFAETDEARLRHLEQKVALRLAFDNEDTTEAMFMPERLSIENFISKFPFIFLGLHGGAGEDGTLQAQLEKSKAKHNGSGIAASRLCMDKHKTAQALSDLHNEGIFVTPQCSMELQTFEKFSEKKFELFWKGLKETFVGKHLIAKPQSDGCSSGVILLKSNHDLQSYIKLLLAGAQYALPGTFDGQDATVEMPGAGVTHVLFEKFIETDALSIANHKLKWKPKTGWIEVTVGVVEQNGKIHALSPSITVAEGTVLSVEEKFQGGTGINITPPPEHIISKQNLTKAKRRIEKVAETLGINGYARIDAFLEVATGNIHIIEANTLPALTPSTVIFHQALAEPNPQPPLTFLEQIIANSGY